MRKITIIFAWFFTSVGLVLTSLAGFHLVYSSQPKPLQVADEMLNPVAIATPTENEIVRNGEGDVQGVSTLVEIKDARAEIVANFLARYNSPLEPHDEYGEILVRVADKYNIDFRLLPAIMMQESNLCKNIPQGTHNCLGFGIHSRGTLGFESYEAGFERAAREIKANYIDIGLTTPEEIMTKYTPSSNGSWANSVNQWMAEMRYDDRQLGRELKSNADVLEFIEDDTAEVE